MKKPPVIVWDIDDVLNDFTVEWLRFFGRHHPCSVVYEQLTENPPTEVLGIGLDEYRESLDEFRGRYMLELKPRPELLQWFEVYGDACRHMALTAVPMEFAHLSAFWVIRHFGRWIRSFHFVPSPRNSDNFVRHERTKGDMLEKLGEIDIFIDDAESNIESAGHLALRSIVFPAPWNRRRGESIAAVTDSLVDFLNKRD